MPGYKLVPPIGYDHMEDSDLCMGCLYEALTVKCASVGCEDPDRIAIGRSKADMEAYITLKAKIRLEVPNG